MAKCLVTGMISYSNKHLPYFEKRPDKMHDYYYSGYIQVDGVDTLN